MAELIEKANAMLQADELHPLTVIGCFLVNFLAIHPFQDGNGRLSRALTNLLLLRAGYEYVPYASLERVIKDNKPAYYAALRQSQMAMKEDPTRFGSWLTFFLHALRTQKRTLQSKLDLNEKVDSILLQESSKNCPLLLPIREQTGLLPRFTTGVGEYHAWTFSKLSRQTDMTDEWSDFCTRAELHT